MIFTYDTTLYIVFLFYLAILGTLMVAIINEVDDEGIKFYKQITYMRLLASLLVAFLLPLSIDYSISSFKEVTSTKYKEIKSIGSSTKNSELNSTILKSIENGYISDREYACIIYCRDKIKENELRKSMINDVLEATLPTKNEP